MSTTQRQARHSQFKRGQGVYACRCCNRNTRDTGDNGGVQLCPECYDLAGEENHMSDNGGALYESPANVLSLIDYVASKGGNVACWANVKARALELLPAATPAPAIGKPVATPRLDGANGAKVLPTMVELRKFAKTIQSSDNRATFSMLLDCMGPYADMADAVSHVREHLADPSFQAEQGSNFKHINAYFQKFGI